MDGLEKLMEKMHQKQSLVAKKIGQDLKKLREEHSTSPELTWKRRWLHFHRIRQRIRVFPFALRVLSPGHQIPEVWKKSLKKFWKNKKVQRKGRKSMSWWHTGWSGYHDPSRSTPQIDQTFVPVLTAALVFRHAKFARPHRSRWTIWKGQHCEDPAQCAAWHRPTRNTADKHSSSIMVKEKKPDFSIPIIQ